MSNVMTPNVTSDFTPVAASAAVFAVPAWHAVSALAFASAYGATAVATRAIDVSGTTNTAGKRTAHLVTSRASSPPV